jgi:hypothetical protein
MTNPHPSKHEADRREQTDEVSEELHVKHLVEQLFATSATDEQLKIRLVKNILALNRKAGRQRAREELEKIEPLTHDGRGTILWEMDSICSSIETRISELDKEIKASRLDAEGGKS